MAMPAPRAVRRSAANHTFILAGAEDRAVRWVQGDRIVALPQPAHFYGIYRDDATGRWCCAANGMLIGSQYASASGALAALEAHSEEANADANTAGTSATVAATMAPAVTCEVEAAPSPPVPAPIAKCCQMLEKLGGAFGCELPFGHDGAHMYGSLGSRRVSTPSLRSLESVGMDDDHVPSRRPPRSSAKPTRHVSPNTVRGTTKAPLTTCEAVGKPGKPAASADAASKPAIKKPPPIEKPPCSSTSSLPPDVAKLRDEMQEDGMQLLSMDYDEVVADRAEFLAEQIEHPDNGEWGDDWPPELAAALRDRPLRKRHTWGEHTLVTCGKVVGCTERWFQIAYEDDHTELRSWHDVRQLLVPHPERDRALTVLAASLEGFSRSSHRRHKKRDLDEECDAYLPRLGCHHSLPPNKVACRLHESLRLSGLVRHDTGPAESD